jgi:ABC-type nitrate/sulfonate/bicarbonate transport system substrate-binding protein
MKRMLNLADLIDLPLSGIGVTDKKLETEREQVKKVIRATLRGTRFMKQNRAETLTMMTDYLRITPAQAAQAYDASINSFTEDGFVSEKGLLLDVQLTKERLKLAKDIPLSQVVDWSLLKEIKASTK